MTPSSNELDHETEKALQQQLDHSESEVVVDTLDRALDEANDDEAQYWLRTACQHLLIETPDGNDRENSN